jgi:hypothetical protein
MNNKNFMGFFVKKDEMQTYFTLHTHNSALRYTLFYPLSIQAHFCGIAAKIHH